MDSTQGRWCPGQGKAVQGLKHLLALLPSLHRNPEAARYQRQQEKMEAAQGRPRKAVVAMAPVPSCRQSHAWSASPRHQKRLPRTSVALIAMHVSRHHREGFRALEKWRYKRALHGAAVCDQGAVRIGRVVQQHQHTPYRKHALKARELLPIPSLL